MSPTPFPDSTARPPAPGTDAAPCASCSERASCAAGSEAEAPPVAPGGAIGLFLVPVATAAAGAWLGRASAPVQLAAGLAGLALGMGLAWAGHRLYVHRKEREP